ncbi:MAG: imidazole glycerol phosphate synthase subunit HisF [Moraxellaceae bacterium]|nr:imidazole glycerol phosphate synthase subunit HisF [Moraxellaceae bacterium]
MQSVNTHNKTIGIIDTQAGNVTSLLSCFEKMGYQPIIINSDCVNSTVDIDVLVIPGQGHFGEVMHHLQNSGLDTIIKNHINQERTLIGICVGMQILFDSSEESPNQQGLGLIKGKVTKLNSPKQPMVGWSRLSATETNSTDIDDEVVYFVNSYAVKDSDKAIATTHYGEEFVTAVQDGKVFGFQFHPEKSGEAGRRILQKAIDNSFTPIENCKKNNNNTDHLLPRVIACLDVADGRVVKGTQFVDIKDMGDPVVLAKRYEDQGADEILYLDITATNEQRKNALDTVQKVAKSLSIPLTVGGGLRSLHDVAEFLNAGADKVALNSSAVANPQLINDIAQRYGSQSLVVAIDAFLEDSGQYRVYTHGGKRQTDLDAIEWAKQCADRGAGEILLTAKHRDGTGKGFDNVLMKELSSLPIQIIASGGASNSQHFVDTFIAGSDAGLAAGMFHRNEITINQLKQDLLQHNIEVRIC